jgi:hypothetical protein
MRQTYEPERTRSLPNRNLNLSYEDLVVKASVDFGWGGSFEKHRERLNQVGSRLFNRSALTRNFEFRAQHHETIVLTFDNRG